MVKYCTKFNLDYKYNYKFYIYKSVDKYLIFYKYTKINI